MSHGGKGDKRRPTLVDRREAALRWQLCFNKELTPKQRAAILKKLNR